MTAVYIAVIAILAVVAGVALVAQRRARKNCEMVEKGLSQAMHDLRHLERTFALFAPTAVVDKLADGDAKLEPEKRDATVMFADLVGFTRLSEELPAEVMVPVLNGYFTVMNRAIAAHHGAVSRIMGDGLMALFGTIGNNPWHAAEGVRAALAMRGALENYNEELAAKGLPALRFGVGLHRGEVVSAVVGSNELMEFTVIGDPVNVAARVESLTRQHGVDILITEDVRRNLDARFSVKEMPPTRVKGKSEPIGTYAVLCINDERTISLEEEAAASR
jgi:adenylate cyclase